MSRRVPLARRNLFGDRRRAALAVGGVSVALLLVLVLDGIFAGTMRQVTAYIDTSRADAFVSQRGVRTMHMSSSALDPAAVDAVRSVDGVAWAEGIRFTSVVVRSRTGRQLSYLIGYERRGGPARIVTGRRPGHGEAIVDRTGASELGVGVGDRVWVGDVALRVSGLSTGGTSITNTTTFVRSDDFASARGPAVAYVLAGAVRGVAPDALARRIAAAVPEVTVQTRVAFSRSEARIVADMSADVMRIMTIIGFAMALAVIGMTLFTATLAKLREYGVCKALGARTRRLGAVVVGQGVWLVAAAIAVAVALTFAAAAGVASLTPHVRIAVEPASVARTAAGALAVGLLGALVPLARVARVDPASVFRGT